MKSVYVKLIIQSKQSDKSMYIKMFRIFKEENEGITSTENGEENIKQNNQK